MNKIIVFHSVFHKELKDFVDYKQAIGYKYEAPADLLCLLDTFFIRNNLDTKYISKELMEEWIKKRNPETIATRNRRVSILNQFIKYLDSVNIKSYFIPPKTIVTEPRYEAHIYTDDELNRFFKAADNCRFSRYNIHRQRMLPLFFRILYTSGLRLGELCHLTLGDINFEESYITVYGAKNGKDRIVPIHPRLCEKCVELKNDIHMLNSKETPFFFINTTDRPYSESFVYRVFRDILEDANIPHTGKGPRVHDFRHTYAVNICYNWLKDGKNLENLMEYLRTMLGHETLSATLYYVKLISVMFPHLLEKMEKNNIEIIEEVVYDEKEYE